MIELANAIVISSHKPKYPSKKSIARILAEVIILFIYFFAIHIYLPFCTNSKDKQRHKIRKIEVNRWGGWVV